VQSLGQAEFKNEVKEMDKLKIGILGGADIVERRILPSLEDAGNVILSGIASRGDGERISRIRSKFDTGKAYTGYDELLSDPAVEAVYIPLPNGLHFEWAKMALEAKKHVLCEKPLCPTASEAEELFGIAKQNGVKLFEAFACMQSPLFRVTREMIGEGHAGNIKTINAYFHYLMRNPKTSSVAKPNLAGGALLDVGCYNMLTFMELTGKEPAAVRGFYTEYETGVDASHTAVLDFGGFFGISQCGIDSVRRTGFNVLGDEGYISFDRTPNAWGELTVCYNGSKGKGTKNFFARNNYTAEFDAFAGSVIKGIPFAMTEEKSIRNAKAIDLVRSSLARAETDPFLR
jgi:predicted dehydrogenase